MNYTELTIGANTYQLKLTTRTSIQLEKALGYNPINMLIATTENKMPKMMDMITMLHAMLQNYHHGFNIDKTMDLFDKYIEEGHNMYELINVFVDVFKKSGYLPDTDEEEVAAEKN